MIKRKSFLTKKSKLKKKSTSFGKQKVREDGLTMKDFFMEIWEEAEHPVKCFETGQVLGEPLTTMFAHILPKNKYPQYSFEKWNIQIVKPEIHKAFDAGYYDKTPNMKNYLECIKDSMSIS